MWELFAIIGTVAFAISGASVAMEEEYDLLGVYVLAFITAFGGGAIRNVLLGLPLELLWDQKIYFLIAFAVTTLLFYFPSKVLPYWEKWGVLTDAIGLSAFAIQGALLAHTYHLPIPAMVLAALLTGVGGGIVRDLLAKRQPFVLKYDLYAVWAMIGGLLVSIETLRTPASLYILFALLILLRMISYTYGWSLPRPKKQIS